uniref:Uncharacterized protein n=1 Tax=Siphoviridae sp. ctl0E3 TaxID=2827586 RepID=A0A8S5LNS2_9CAUD|nr:MAG TPA: hypothetical protein [Siphoviridae sp. ctl0E3]
MTTVIIQSSLSQFLIFININFKLASKPYNQFYLAS